MWLTKTTIIVQIFFIGHFPVRMVMKENTARYPVRTLDYVRNDPHLLLIRQPQSSNISTKSNGRKQQQHLLHAVCAQQPGLMREGKGWLRPSGASSSASGSRKRALLMVVCGGF
jgi:hypothetical protein